MTEEPLQKVETFFQNLKEEPKAETKPAVENTTEAAAPKPTESEFTFVNKTADQEKITERRNKLKEFKPAAVKAVKMNVSKLHNPKGCKLC